MQCALLRIKEDTEKIQNLVLLEFPKKYFLYSNNLGLNALYYYEIRN